MPRSHKTLPRLYLDTPLAQGTKFELARDQANYLLNVLRRRAGDPVVVFNGRDGAWRADIAEAGRKSATLTLLECVAPQTPTPDLWSGFAPLKAARLDYMMQKATEMGVGQIQPVMTQFTQVSRIKHERIKANVIEAAEQCEVLSIPQILPEITLPKLLAQWPQTHADRFLVFADEEMASGTPIDTLKGLAGKRIGLIIGPEGGFSDQERALLKQQDFVVPISLGPRILRADTAAVAALTAIQSTIGDWG